MKYANQATVDFAKAIGKEDCLEPIDKLIIKEGCEDQFPDIKGDILVLDMDCVEWKDALIEKRDRFKSMDSAFIIENENEINQEIVFVEFRFNYKNLSNLKKQELFDKVEGSTAAIKQNVKINQNYYFVFNSNLKQQAISRFNRMNPAMPQHFIAVDMNDIREIFFNKGQTYPDITI